MRRIRSKDTTTPEKIVRSMLHNELPLLPSELHLKEVLIIDY
jgi:hypothetical protein